MVTYRDDLPARMQSPIQVLIRPSVVKNNFVNRMKTCYRYATNPSSLIRIAFLSGYAVASTEVLSCSYTVYLSKYTAAMVSLKCAKCIASTPLEMDMTITQTTLTGLIISVYSSLHSMTKAPDSRPLDVFCRKTEKFSESVHIFTSLFAAFSCISSPYYRLLFLPPVLSLSFAPNPAGTCHFE